MNKEKEQNRPEGWDEISFNLGFATPYKAASFELAAFSAGVEAGADALIVAGYRLPPDDKREAVTELLNKERHSWHWEVPCDGYDFGERTCVKCGKALSITSHVKVGVCQAQLKGEVIYEH